MEYVLRRPGFALSKSFLSNIEPVKYGNRDDALRFFNADSANEMRGQLLGTRHVIQQLSGKK